MLLLPTAQSGTPENPEPTVHTSIFTHKPRIPEGITVSGVNLGGMTEEAALDALRPALPQPGELTITYGDSRLTLSPADTQVHWDYETAVAAALQGRQTEVSIAYNKDTVRRAVKDFFISLGGIYTPSGFWLEGEMPDLSVPGGTCQTLVLNTGAKGLPIYLDDVYGQIRAAYASGTTEILLEDAGQIQEPQPLVLEEITDQVCVPATEPDIDRNTLEILPGKPGYGFDTQKAAMLLDTSIPGETIRIPMAYVEPTLTEEDVWFLDVLGFCKTPYKENENRTENLRLACAKLDGLILQPGQTLSYNETLGKRTREAGYKPAPAYSGTDLVDEVGGGICQVSSTLYLSSLFAELSIVERRNHGYPAEYIPMGLDATVNWGTTDLKIRNDYELPVKLRAEVGDDGYVRVWVLGVEQRSYDVKMEYRVDDHPTYAAAFRCRYDKETGEEIYRKLDHTSIYLEEVWCWPGYAENITDER